MKLAYVDLCGFRGYRKRLRIDFAEDFTIIDGRNGVGKSTIFDAVEYALDAFQGVPGVFVNGSNDYFGPQFKSPLRYFTGPSARPDKAATLDIERLERLSVQLGPGRTYCALAPGAVEPLQSALRFFRSEFEHGIKGGASSTSGKEHA